MPKFIAPSLADLSQDIAGAIPVEVVSRWIEEERSEEKAQEILSQYKVRGTLVSSDTSGLSRLSQEKDLLDVLKIISDPKEVVFGLGKKIGGVAVGRWIADNTQMFYPENVAIEDVVNTVFEANKRILEDQDVRLGFCIHHGEFLSFAGGMFGEHADFMEEVAENRAEGGQVLITKTVAEAIKEKESFAIEKVDIGEALEDVFELKNANGIADDNIDGQDYPLYFSKDFFQMLKEMKEEKDKETIYSKFGSKKVIVLIEKKSEGEEGGLLGLMNAITENLAFSVSLKKAAKDIADAQEIKIAGNLAIFAFDEDKKQSAIDFAVAVREKLNAEGFTTTSGIEMGDVLIFDLEDGTRDIAGGPVNIASKQAQDFGEKGNIYITKAVAENTVLPDNKESYEVEVSKVKLEGFFF